jgi:hypothetical protein
MSSSTSEGDGVETWAVLVAGESYEIRKGGTFAGHASLNHVGHAYQGECR